MTPTAWRTAIMVAVLATGSVPHPASSAAPQHAGPALGLFSGSQDVGSASTIGAGSASFDSQKHAYVVSGGGANMWGTADQFHYVWKKVSGDVTLAATIEFTATRPPAGTPDPHRKACLVIRQTLDSDSVYADAAVHGDGPTSLQWRDEKGGLTHEVQSSVVSPKRVRIERRGNYVSMSLATDGQELAPAGGSARIDLSWISRARRSTFWRSCSEDKGRSTCLRGLPTVNTWRS